MKKFISYFLTVFLLLAGGIAFLVYTQLADLENLKFILAQKIGEITQSEVSIGEAELDLDQGIGVKLKQVSLSKSVNGKPEMQAREILVVIKVIPLLFREIVIEKLVMVGSSIKLTRRPDGIVGVAGLERLLARNDGLKEDISSIIKMGFTPQIIIQESEIEFVDYYERTEPLRIPIKNIRFWIQKAFAKPQFGFSLQGEIPNSNGTSRIAVSGKLQNPSGGLALSEFLADGKLSLHEVFLPQFEPYLQSVSSLGLGNMPVSMETRFSMTLQGPKRFVGNLKYGDPQEGSASPPEDSTASYHGDVDYKIVLQKDTLIIEEALFRSGNFNVRGSGRLDDYASNNPGITFVIRSDEFSRNDVDGFFLFHLLSKEQQQLTRHTLDQGVVEIRSLKFNGNLEQLNHLYLQKNLARLSGELAFKEVRWSSSFLDLDAMSGTLQVASGKCDIKVNKARHSLFPMATLKGEIKDLTNQLVGDLTVDGDLTLQQLKRILTVNVDDRKFQKLLERLQDVSGKGKVHIDFQGPLEDMDRGSANAGFLFAKASYKILDSDDNKNFNQVKNFQGKVSIEHARSPDAKTTSPWKVNLDDFSGNFGPNAFSGLTGKIILGKEKPHFEMDSKVKIHAPTAGDLFELPAVPFWKDIDFKDGMFLIDYHVEGQSFVSGLLKSSAAIELKEISLKLKSQPALWSNLSGKVNLSENKTRIKGIRGRYGDSPFHLDGNIQVQPKSIPTFNVHFASSSLSPADLKGVPFLERFDGGGLIQFDSHWSGTHKAVDFRGNINLKNAFYKFGDWLVKGAGVAGSIQLAGQIETKKAVTVKNLIYKIGGNTIGGEGMVQLSPKPAFKFRAHAENLQTVSLGLPILADNRSGTARFDITGSGFLGKPDSTSFEGGWDFKNLVFEVDNHHLTLNTKASMKGKRLKIQSGNLTFADSSFEFKGMYDLGLNPIFDLVVSGKTLNLNQMWRRPKAQSAGFRSRLENSGLFNTGAGRLVFKLDHLDYKFWRLKNIRGEVSLKEKTFRVNKLEISTPNDNLIKAQGMLALAERNGFRFQNRIYAEGIQARNLFDQFGDTFSDSMSGRIKILQAGFQGEGGNWDEVAHSLDGSLLFHFNSGRINKEKIERGVFSLLGSSKEAKPKKNSKPSSPYEQISGKFNVKKGIAETEDFLFKTPDRVTSLVGKFDLAQNEMDAVVGVAPLAALDKLLSRIPLVGKIITAGDEESLVKSYYAVRGKISSPKVSPIPLTSLGKKVVGIFQGIFQAPKDIISPLP